MFRAIGGIAARFAGAIAGLSSPPRAPFPKKAFILEPLEPRLLLSADPAALFVMDELLTEPDGQGAIVLQLDAAANAAADSYTLRLNGENLELLAGTSVVLSRSLAATSAVVINGEDEYDDTLTVDFDFGGFFSVAGGITFNGGTNGVDSLIVAGGAFSSVSHFYSETGPGLSGSMTFDNGVQPALTIDYTDLEPLTNTGTAINLVYTLTGLDDQAVLEDDGNPTNHMSRLRSANGTFETTTFTSDTATSLTINLGDGNDSLTINDLPEFGGSLTVNGGAGTDSINFNGLTALTALTTNISGSLTKAPGVNLSVSGDASLTAGSISLESAGIVNFGALNFNAPTGTVSITEQSDMVLRGSNSAATLTLTTLASLTDQSISATSIGVTGSATFNANFPGNTITLSDTAGDQLSVGSVAAFSAAGTITIGANGNVNFGSLRFNSAGAVTVTEDSDTALAAANSVAGGGLSLTSSGSITDGPGAFVTVIGGASFTGRDIFVTDSSGDILNVTGTASFTGTGSATTGTIVVGPTGNVSFGKLNFNTPANVTITEDSEMVLTGVNTGDSLNLVSANDIIDDPGTSLTQTGATQGASLRAIAGSIRLGDNSADITNFAQLTFNASAAVSISEDSDTILLSSSSAGSLVTSVVLTSAGSITKGFGGSIRASSAELNAGLHIGTSGPGAVDLDVTSLHAASGTTGAGGVFINDLDSNADGLSINQIIADDGTGAIELTTAGGDIRDGNGVSINLFGGAATLTAGRHIGFNGTTVDALDTFLISLTATSGTAVAPGGDIYIQEVNSGGSLALNAITADGGAGAITITLPAGANVGNITDGNGTAVNLRGAAVTLSASGSISTSDALEIVAGSLTAMSGTDATFGGNINLTHQGAGSLALNTIRADGGDGQITINSTSSTADILDGNGAALNLDGSLVTLTSGRHIGTAADPLDTEIGNLAAASGVGAAVGDIYINELASGGSLAVNTISADGGNGILSITTNGATADITDGNGNALNLVGSLILSAGRHIGFNGTTIDALDDDVVGTLTATSGTASAVGDIYLVEAPSGVSLRLSTVTANEGTGTISILANNQNADISDGNGAAVNLRGSSVTLHAGRYIGFNFITVDPLETEIGSLSATAGTNVTSGTGEIYIDEQESALAVQSINSTGKVALSALSEITVTGNVDARTNDVLLTAPNVTIAPTGVLNVDLSTAGNTRYVVSGTANLGGTLDAELVGGFTPATGDRFRFMTFDSRSGFFDTTNLPEDFVVDQTDPFDLELVFALSAPAIVYVDDDFTGSAGTPIVDADPVASGNQAAVVGVNAFATIQSGVNAVAEGGTVNVNSHGPNAAPTGAYAESVSITKALTLDGNAISGLAEHVVIDPAAGNGINVSGASAENVTIRDLRVTGSVDGIHAIGSGNLTIASVQADNNTGDGINLTSVGAVTFDGVTARGNADDGIEISSAGEIAFTNGDVANNGDAGVVVTGAASFSDSDGVYSRNNNHGIRLVDIAGLVSLTRTTANDNDGNVGGLGDGVNMTDGADAGTEAIGSLEVTGGSFQDTAAAGAQRYGIRVGDGVGVGAVHSVGGSVVFQSDSAAGPLQHVSITGNLNSGVEIEDGGSTASVTGAGNYSGNGASGPNQGTGFTIASLSGGFTASDGTFSNNTGHGLSLASVGDVDLTGISATGNDPGVLVNGAASFSDTDGVYTGNDNHGIQLVDIAGLVSLTRTTANDNDANNDGIGDGVNMTDGGDLGTDAIGSLSVTGGNFSNTAAAGGQVIGIRVGDGIGVGAVHSVGGSVVFQSDSTAGPLQHVSVTGNQLSGIEIEDGGTTASFSGNGNYSSNLNAGVVIASLSGGFTASDSTFSGNNNHGIQLIDIGGLVSLTRVTANDNDANVGGLGDGVNMTDGADAGTEAIGSLQVTGGSFQDTAAAGAQRYGIRVGDGVGVGLVHSVGGSVVFQSDSAAGPLQHVSITGNLNSGVEIEDGGTTASVSGNYSSNLGTGFTIASLSGGFTASDGTFSNNTSHGLSLTDIDGAVSLTGVTASDNGGNGFNAVDGSDADTLALGGLSVSGSTFDDTASGNAQLFGVLAGDAGGDVLFDASGASGNDAGGVQIGNVAGAVSFSGVNYSNNGGDGIHVASLTTSLTVIAVIASGNAGDGIDVDSAGTATLGATQASSNSGDGLQLSTSGFVSLGGSVASNFNGNGDDGIEIGSAGAIAFTNVAANNNGDAGVVVSGAASFSDNEGVYSHNTNHGIRLVDIAGLVSLTRTTANDNDANLGGVGDGVNMTDGADAGTEAIGSLQVTGGSFSDTAAAGAQRYGIRVGDGVGVGAVHSVGGSVVFQSDSAVGPLQHVTITGNLNSGVEIEDGGTTASVSGTYSNNLGAGFTIASLSGGFTASDGTFSNNTSHGISLTDIDGAVSLTGVTASDNGGNGLNAVDGSDADTLALGGLSVSGSTFDDTAAGNAQGFGVFVGDVSGDVLFDASGASGNDAGGVQIGNVAGAVSFSGVNYSNNGGDGIHVASLTTSLTVIAVIASGNAGDGIDVDSAGTAILGATQASSNSGDGLQLSTSGFVSLGGSVASNFNGNGDDGIEIGSAGAIAFTNVAANNNGDAGVVVSGAASFSDNEGVYSHNTNHGIRLVDIAGLVSLTRTTANDNDANLGGVGDGVNMTDGADAGTEAIGSLQVTGGSFSDTAAAGAQRYGIRVGDGVGVGAVHSVGGSVVFQSDSAVGPLQHVSITGNLNSGVEIEDGGSTASVTGAGNYSGNGAAGPNQGTGFTIASLSGGFTASDGTFSNNTSHGISLTDIDGAVSLTGVTASDNGGNGLNAVDGSDADTLALGGLSVSGSTFDDTASGNAQLFGVLVGDAGGDVLFDDSGASGDALGGVQIGIVAGIVTFTSTSGASYSNTGGDGIHVATLFGALTVSGVTASGNAGDGIDVDSAGTAILGAIQASNNGGDGIHVASLTTSLTMIGVIASGNAGDGIDVDSAGTAILGAVQASSNSGDGLQLSTSGFVSLGGSVASNFNGNGDDGIEIGSAGAIAFTNVAANNNADAGVVVTGAASFSDNEGVYSHNTNHGIRLIDIAGLVSLTRTTANDNDANLGGVGDGVNMTDGADAGTEAIGSLQVTGGSFQDTAAAGVQRYGIRVGDGVGVGLVHSVGGSVVFQSDSAAGPLQHVTITGNLNSGVEIEDGGTSATFTNGTYSNNGGDGIRVASLATTLTVSGVTANNNTGDGLDVTDGGATAFLSGVFANNTGRGVNLASGTIFVNGNLASGTGAIVLTAPSGVFFTADAVLNVDIAGTAPGQFTNVAITGAATLDGTLDAELVGGFVPTAGDRFQFMTFNSRSGSFATTNLPDDFEVRDTAVPVGLELVFAPNDPPVAVGDAYATNEDTLLTVPAPGVLGNDTDPDGDAMTAILVAGPAHGTLTFNSDGSFTYAPGLNFNGSDSFTYKVSDGELESGVATVTLTVNSVNDAPVADNEAYSVNEDNTLMVGAASGVLNGDSDPSDTPPNHLSAILVTNVTHGVLALNADGSFTYTPNANFNGTDVFTYRVRDDGGTARGGVDTGNVATVTLTVNPVNDAPIVTAGANQVVGLQDIDDDDHGKGHDHHDGKHDKDHDRPEAEVQIAATFTDVEAGDVHTATINWGDGSRTMTGQVTEPTGAAAGTVKGGHTYTAAGVYTVTVTVSDGHGGVGISTLTITVKKPTDKKGFEAKQDEYKLDEDTVLRVNAANGVLANDRAPSSPPLKARVVEGPAHGKLTFNADGSFVYVPDRDFHGTDSFWYEFTDGNNVSRAVEVALKVKDVKDKPSNPCVDWRGWV